MAARSSLRIALSLLTPPRCGVCARPAPPECQICARCAFALTATPSLRFSLAGIDETVALSSYEGPARALVSGLKFGARPGLARVAASLLAPVLAQPAPLADAVVPVPAAPLRRLRRGFDPAETLAVAVAAELALPVVPCLRRRHGPRQVGRARAVRLADPPRVASRPPVPRAPLLVDDVVTTGATLRACAIALRAAGAGRVIAATIARA